MLTQFNANMIIIQDSYVCTYCLNEVPNLNPPIKTKSIDIKKQ